MSADPTLRELLEVQAYFSLPSPALVEKDFYVVKALAAIAAIDTGPLRLVFGGGTALSRTHRLIRRMPEDIDFRIVLEDQPARGALRRLREAVTQALLDAGFKFDPADPAYRQSGNKGRYTIYRLPYEPVARGEGVLRPTIRIETAVWSLRRPSVDLPVILFIAEALSRPPEVAHIACASILETAADKFVALTRRAGAELAGLDEPDPALVRHLHDLHVLRGHYDPAEVAVLAREIMIGDAESYGNRFPAYRENPMAETLRAIEGLAADAGYARRYEEFQRLMVFGSRFEYAACIDTLRLLATKTR
ncbi:MAG TPA: nucleotidyl transferase AbiEii/AbiGii toxin family protein [Stellaceae bacterium]|nr:nucleotidyl transferase AbiEii/AbiGii toxin family protein [Stellaceae bacterium]